MTTIEFCEKTNSSSYKSIYSMGTYHNIASVLGPNPLLWLLPLGLPDGDGLSYLNEHTQLITG